MMIIIVMMLKVFCGTMHIKNAMPKKQKKIKEELIPIAWHPSRWWDWCVPEHEKKQTKK